MITKIKVEAIFKLKDYWCFEDQEEIDWFTNLFKNKKETTLILWSKEVGDEIASTSDISLELINE